ncbi:MAG: hypothetical protein K9W44_05565 [Candidatus Lokiarchaeota archaeon]|nr:hypothetical protein [Candidatus Harpocratesius repetitus]
MRKINLVLFCGISLLLINATMNVTLGVGDGVTTDFNNSTYKQGEFAGQYYYSYYWYNETFPTWEYQDDYTYWELLWLNNGTEDTWVVVVVDYNMTINDSGNLSYLNFNIYDDPDGSFLTNYDDNWSEFDAVDWEGYDDYYVDENADVIGWDENWTDSNDTNWDDSWLDNWDISDNGVVKSENVSEGFSGDFSDEDPGESGEYSTMEESLTGDEGLWFIDIYFEEWATTYTGSINYTWYNVEYSDDYEIILGSLIDPSNLGPASTSPYSDSDDDYWWYDWDWEWAQMMMINETYDDETYSWTWFSYDIGQWVSFYDNLTNQYTFLSQDVAYIGMSLYEDINGNGVVDVSYDPYYENESYWDDEEWMLSQVEDVDEGSISDPTYDMNVSDSEEKYLLTLNSVGNVVWGIPEISENSAEFWICLEDVDFLAVPYASNYEWFMDDSSDGSLIIASNVDHLNISFAFESGETGSSVAVKHDIADFTDPETHNSITAFENLSMTIDYSMYIDQYSELMACDTTEEIVGETGEEFDSAMAFDGEITIDLENQSKELMSMDFTMPYTWGKDGVEYNNTVAISPIYGYEYMYSDEEVGQASSFSYISNSYIYSMCFNWQGYSIIMDPTFVSYYVDIKNDAGLPGTSLFKVGGIVVLSILAGIGLVVILKKAKFR